MRFVDGLQYCCCMQIWVFQLDIKTLSCSINPNITRFRGSPVFHALPCPAPHPSTMPSLCRSLDWRSLLVVGVGSTIGSGLFVVLGSIARDQSGPATPLSYALAAGAALLVAMCYAECSVMMPKAGGTYTFIGNAFHPLVAYACAIDLLVEYVGAMALVAHGFANHALDFITTSTSDLKAIREGPIGWNEERGFFWTGNVCNVFAVAIGALVTSMLVLGVKKSATINTYIVASKVGIIVFASVVGAFYIDGKNYTPFMPYGFIAKEGKANRSVGVLAGAGIAIFAFFGFETVACSAEEAKNPSFDMPISIIGSIAIATILYVAMSLVVVGMMPFQQISVEAAIPYAFGYIGMRWAQLVIAATAMIGIASVLFAFMMAMPRILLAMARDGFVGKFFMELHPQYGTLYKSTIFVGAMITVVAGLAPMRFLMRLLNASSLLSFSMVCLAVVRMRYTHPSASRAFQVPFSPFIPLLGSAMCFFLIYELDLIVWFKLAFSQILAWSIYFCYGKKQRQFLLSSTNLDSTTTANATLLHDPKMQNISLELQPIHDELINEEEEKHGCQPKHSQPHKFSPSYPALNEQGYAIIPMHSFDVKQVTNDRQYYDEPSETMIEK